MRIRTKKNAGFGIEATREEDPKKSRDPRTPSNVTYLKNRLYPQCEKPGRPSGPGSSNLVLGALFSLLLAAGWFGANGCASSKRSISPEAGQESLVRAEEAIAQGDLSLGVKELVALRKRAGLSPSLREKAEHTLIDTGIQEIEVQRGNASALRRIYESDYPERVRARAGLLAADALFENDHPVDAFNLIQKLDRKFPHHPERALAGRILGKVGLHLIDRKGRYSLIFRYRAKGIRALEYLVLRYPLDSNCDEAYFALSQRYEKDKEIDYSLERIEDLLIYHPGSPYAIAAQARLPYLRLLRLDRNDYDRGELAVASGEIRNWLAQHEGHELEGWVRELGQACATRLAESDLSLAHYYERIGAEEGKRLHARRALAIAQRSNLEPQMSVARALLGPETAVPEATTPRPAGSGAASGTEEAGP